MSWLGWNLLNGINDSGESVRSRETATFDDTSVLAQAGRQRANSCSQRG